MSIGTYRPLEDTARIAETRVGRTTLDSYASGL